MQEQSVISPLILQKRSNNKDKEYAFTIIPEQAFYHKICTATESKENFIHYEIMELQKEKQPQATESTAF